MSHPILINCNFTSDSLIQHSESSFQKVSNETKFIFDEMKLSETESELRYLKAQRDFPEIDFEELESQKFILVSFGSVAKVKLMSKTTFEIFIREFSKLNYTVIWATNSDLDEFLTEEEKRNIPKNIKLIRWAPLKLLLGKCL